jgi:group I intron endonuclease
MPFLFIIMKTLFFNRALNFSLNQLKFFSSASSKSSRFSGLNIPVKSYPNSDLQKQNILIDNKDKAGIYQWTNLLNGKSYIGSAVNLSNRLYRYYSAKCLVKDNMTINKALLKYGYSNFSMEILEYCNVDELLKREQYYFDLLNPEYNILKKAGNSLGLKHSEETREKMSLNKMGDKNPMFGKFFSEETIGKMSEAKRGKTHSEETMAKLSEVKKGDKNPNFGKTRSNETKKKISETKGTTIYVYSLNYQLLQIFVSSRKAGEYLKCTHPMILKYTRSGEIFKDQYILSFKELSPSSDSSIS